MTKLSWKAGGPSRIELQVGLPRILVQVALSRRATLIGREGAAE